MRANAILQLNTCIWSANSNSVCSALTITFVCLFLATECTWSHLGQRQGLWMWTRTENINWLQLLSKFNSNSSHSINSLFITQIYETITVSYITWPYMHGACLLMLCANARQKKKAFQIFW